MGKAGELRDEGFPWLSSGLVLVLGLGISVLAGKLDNERQRVEERNHVIAELALVRARVEGLIKGTYNATDGLVYLISLQGGISETVFEEMARRVLEKNPAVRNISVAPGDVIRMVYPVTGNERALGFDFGTNPEQARTVQMARERGTALLAGPVALVQGGQALIQRSPVFVRNAQGQPTYWGAVSTVATVANLLQEPLASRSQGLHFAVRGKDGLGERGEMIDGNPDIFQADPLLMDVEVPGGKWQLAAIPEDGWAQGRFYVSPYFLLGVAISLLVAGVAGLRALYARQLAARNQRLESEVRERKRVEIALREDQQRLKLSAAVLDSTGEGVLITDVRGVIVAVNRAFCAITGYSEAEALGKTPGMLRSEHQGQDFYRQMWKTLAEGDIWRGEIWNRRKTGEVYPEWLTISAIRDDEGGINHYVGVFSDISSLKQSQERLEHLAHFDSLTDLPNRVLFQDRLGHAIERSARYQELIGVLILDLDGFKNVNDSLGHPVGDRLLQQVAIRLQACVRGGDTVARLGGDEFAVILSGLSDGSDVVEVVRKIQASIGDPFDLDGIGAMVGVSVGVAIYPADGQTPTELVRNADAAMYGAKEGGRNTYRFYRASMTQDAQQRLLREAALRRGIEQGEFEVWFQPQISLHSRKVTGAEALLRWRDPQRGMVSPAEFIPLAERTGLILELGEQVLAQVCACASRWRQAGLRFGRLALNVATPQIERGDFAASIRRTLAAYDLPADCLEVEITESLIMATGEARDVLLEIQSFGVTTAVDDFGTGYSSLAYLKELPIDNLKIDRAFVKDLPTSSRGVTIASAIIAMAHSLGFRVTAEGIEDEAQLQWLIDAGCDEAQGYFIGRPMPATDFEAWLRAYQPH